MDLRGLVGNDRAGDFDVFCKRLGRYQVNVYPDRSLGTARLLLRLFVIIRLSSTGGEQAQCGNEKNNNVKVGVFSLVY
jgi:hypothetical protein